MDSPRLAPSLARRLLIVALVAVIPLGAIGLWATQSAGRSGRMLRRAQLEEQLDEAAREVEHAWDQQRSALLTLGENEPVRLVLIAEKADTNVPTYVERAFASMTAFDQVIIRDRSGRARITLATPFAPSEQVSGSRGAMPSVKVRVPITDLMSGDTIGVIEASIRLAALVPAITKPVVRGAPLLQVVLPNDVRMQPGESDPRLFNDESVVWDGDRWTTVRRHLAEPVVQLALAGPLSAFESPFRRAAQRNAILFLLTFGAVGIVVITLVRRLTRDVERELAQREALAAVGEFASELAHEVRNPLTAMRLDLQRAQEQVTEPADLEEILPRVLGQIDRLDRAVSGALRVARSGSLDPEVVDLHAVLDAARRSAEPEFARRNARVSVVESSHERLMIDGDAGALEQLFLNLLINAAQALAPAGDASVAARREGDEVEVTVTDNGAGMTAEQLARSEQPLHSTRRDGSGLGLKIVRRIVASHGGNLIFESRASLGTTVRVRLPIRRQALRG